MAEALLSVVGEKIKHAIETGFRLVTGADDDLKWLSSTFSTIQSLLCDAEARQFEEESLRNWLADLKDVVHDVDDLLDEWQTLQLKAEINPSGDDGGFIKKVSNVPYLSFCHYKTRWDMTLRVREVREKLDVINNEKDKYRLLPSGKIQMDDFKFEYWKPTSFIDESEVIGRNDENDAIISRLTSNEKGICVLSIVGMVGLGKTTLAQLVYNDCRVKSHFKKRIWIYVSGHFDVASLTKKILKDVVGSGRFSNLLGLNNIQTKLVEALGNEPFLIVLDDVWNEEISEWETFMLPFKCSGMCGSKILITTRNEYVAIEAGAAHIHHPNYLSEEDSWSLFSCRAFLGREKEECLKLKNIGRKIVKKCEGVPLSLKTIGSVMQRKKTVEDWEHVLKSLMRVSLQQCGKGILPALLLSYDNLPMHLKQCFAYHAVFPKGYLIKKDDLITLWTAEGFIRYEEGRQLGEIGSDYFDDLLCYSLFQVAYKGDDHVQYIMHDLFHDLARYVAKNECYIAVYPNRGLLPAKCRHLSLIEFGRDESLDIASLGNLKYLRTLFFPSSSSIRITSLDSLEQATFLRILDLQNSAVENLPNSIGNLKYLRYLNLSYTRIKELPESVCNLCNLQTLDLNGCKLLSKLPIGLSKLVKLRHLMFQYTGDLVNIPNGIGRLTELQTLTEFIVGGEGGCKIGELGNLNFLRGCLEIKNLERVLNGNEAGEAKLEKKQHLQELVFHCKAMHGNELRMLYDGEMKRLNEILESLRPPCAKLKKLDIENYIGSMFPRWLDESSLFSKLSSITLSNCRKIGKLPTLGTLPSLEYLCIEYNDKVESVGYEFTGTGPIAFPKLKTLIFIGMYKWEEWELGVGDGGIFMPSLLYLTVEDCPHLMLELRRLATPRLKTLSIWNIRALHGSKLPLLSDLEELYISKLANMMSLPRDGWEGLQSLHTLEICNCFQLTSLPDGLQQLKFLKSLAIVGCPQVNVMQEWLGELKSLRRLSIDGHDRMRLPPHWIWRLTSLEELWIFKFYELRSMPSEVMQLTTLKKLRISECPYLKESCKKDVGSDNWFKIAHIDNIWIDDRNIRLNGRWVD